MSHVSVMDKKRTHTERGRGYEMGEYGTQMNARMNGKTTTTKTNKNMQKNRI